MRFGIQVGDVSANDPSTFRGTSQEYISIKRHAIAEYQNFTAFLLCHGMRGIYGKLSDPCYYSKSFRTHSERKKHRGNGQKTLADSVLSFWVRIYCPKLLPGNGNPPFSVRQMFGDTHRNWLSAYAIATLGPP